MQKAATEGSAAEKHASVCGALVRSGVPRDDALVVADVLVEADRRGIAAHGTAVLERYLERLQSGTIAAVPARRTLRETPTSLVLDAGNGLGHPAAKLAMSATIEKARKSGTAFAAVRNSGDFGFAGYYAMMALPHDMIGIAASNAARRVLPTFGSEMLLGPNPLAFAVPAGEEPAFVLDFATTTVQWHAVEALRREGKPVPQAWASGEALLPLGGAGTETGGHKGYGLGLLADIISAVLSSGTLGVDLPLAEDEPYPSQLSHFFGAFRIDGFRDPAEFKSDMDALVRDHRNSEKAPGHMRIYLAGEPEWEKTTLAR